MATAAERVEQLEALAGQGDADTVYRLGRKLCKVDATRAFDTLLKAADLGHGKAQYRVGAMLVKGEGVDVDYDDAKYYINQAAESGIAMAQHAMGVLYYNGAFDDGEKDSIGAAYWLKKAADAGHADAQYRIGGMLLSSDGIIRNITWASEYFLKAAEQGHSKAQGALGILLRAGPTAGLEHRDIKGAARWLRKAAEAGDAEASYTLGCIYRAGEGGMPRDAEAAVRWFTKAGDCGHCEAARELGVMYLTGEGATPDEDGAAYWFIRADTIVDEEQMQLAEQLEQEAIEEDDYGESAYRAWEDRGDEDDGVEGEEEWKDAEEADDYDEEEQRR